jgi:hypothetical protein
MIAVTRMARSEFHAGVAEAIGLGGIMGDIEHRQA